MYLVSLILAALACSTGLWVATSGGRPAEFQSFPLSMRSRARCR